MEITVRRQTSKNCVSNSVCNKKCNTFSNCTVKRENSQNNKMTTINSKYKNVQPLLRAVPNRQRKAPLKIAEATSFTIKADTRNYFSYHTQEKIE